MQVGHGQLSRLIGVAKSSLVCKIGKGKRLVRVVLHESTQRGWGGRGRKGLERKLAVVGYAAARERVFLKRIGIPMSLMETQRELVRNGRSYACLHSWGMSRW